MLRLIILFIFFLGSVRLYAQPEVLEVTSNDVTHLLPLKPTKIELKNNKAVVKGDLSEGEILEDLSWAWNSSVACFPATQQENYTGKHVLFEVIIPKYSEMTITLIPDDADLEMSLYGYQIGVGKTVIVPDLRSCVTCNADNNQTKRAVNNHRKISFTAINRPYKIMIGVAGVKGLSKGTFTLKIERKGR